MRLRSGGNVFGHAQRDRKTLRGADHGVSDAGIPAGGIEQDFARRKFSAALASAMMLEAARSLTDPPGLIHSALPSSSTPGRSRDNAFQPKQRSVADAIETTQPQSADWCRGTAVKLPLRQVSAARWTYWDMRAIQSVGTIVM